MLSFSFAGSTCASVSVMFSRSVLADETQESVIGPLLNTGKDWLTCHRGQKSTRSSSAGEKSDRKKEEKIQSSLYIFRLNYVAQSQSSSVSRDCTHRAWREASWIRLLFQVLWCDWLSSDILKCFILFPDAGISLLLRRHVDT